MGISKANDYNVNAFSSRKLTHAYIPKLGLQTKQKHRAKL